MTGVLSDTAFIGKLASAICLVFRANLSRLCLLIRLTSPQKGDCCVAVRAFILPNGVKCLLWYSVTAILSSCIAGVLFVQRC